MGGPVPGYGGYQQQPPHGYAQQPGPGGQQPVPPGYQQPAPMYQQGRMPQPQPEQRWEPNAGGVVVIFILTLVVMSIIGVIFLVVNASN